MIHTDQETFDTVVQHLRKQGCKALNPKTKGCVYKTEKGLKCAVGILIASEDYSLDMEKRSIEECSLVKDAVIKAGYTNISLISMLQTVHDCYKPHEWENEFCRIAEENQLKYTKL